MGVCGQRHSADALTPGKRPVRFVQEAGWAPGPVWMAAENLTPSGFRSLAVQLVAPKLKQPCQKSRCQSCVIKQVSYRNSQILVATVQNVFTWATQRPWFVPRCEITDSEEDTTTEEITWKMFIQGSIVGRFSRDIIDCLTWTDKFTVRVPPDCSNTIPSHSLRNPPSPLQYINGKVTYSLRIASDGLHSYFEKLQLHHASWLTDWLTEWLTNWLTEWLTNWLTEVRICWSICSHSFFFYSSVNLAFTSTLILFCRRFASLSSFL
jgi:hypothetical protein